MAGYRPLLFRLILPCLFFLTACKSTPPPNSATKQNQAIPAGRPKPSCGAGWVQDSVLWNQKGLYKQIDTAWLDGKCLVIQIQRSGGCGTVQAYLVAQTSHLLSMPPQTELRLLLEGEDHCRANLQEQHRFEISTLANGNRLILHLEDWRSPLHFDP